LPLYLKNSIAAFFTLNKNDMKHITFSETEKFKYALLIKESALSYKEIKTHYIDHINKDILAVSLKYNSENKAPAILMKEYSEELLKGVDSLGVELLIVADSNYFKFLTKAKKADSFGYIKDCAIKGFNHIKVTLSVNYQALFHNPTLKDKLILSNNLIKNYINNTYVPLGINIIHSSKYPNTIKEIKQELSNLHKYPMISCDVETYGLNLENNDIGTIAFAWDKHNGIAFKVKMHQLSNLVKKELKEFFLKYTGTIIYHNATFDIKMLIYVLFMDNPLDYKGTITGLNLFYKRMHDTKIIIYLCTNNAAGNKLGLKHNSYEFAGDYSLKEIKDITKVNQDTLLEYNLIDCLSTWYVFDKFYPKLIKENQLNIYENLMLNSLKIITNMELVGLPINPDKLKKTSEELHTFLNSLIRRLEAFNIIKDYEEVLVQKACEEANMKLKRKKKTIDDFNIKFNPNSGKQLQGLLYEFMGLPILEYTDKGQPATGANTLKNLLNHTNNKNYQEIINTLIEITKVSKIVSTFIPAFNNGYLKQDNRIYLHGSFNLGGTVSGRLSSNSP